MVFPKSIMIMDEDRLDRGRELICMNMQSNHEYCKMRIFQNTPNRKYMLIMTNAIPSTTAQSYAMHG